MDNGEWVKDGFGLRPTLEERRHNVDGAGRLTGLARRATMGCWRVFTRGLN
jgi:hypothetical protein